MRRQPSIWDSGLPEPLAAYPEVEGAGSSLSRRTPSLLGLAPGEACLANRVAPVPVGSYPTFSPLPPGGGFVSVALSFRCRNRVLPGALPYGARTFLPTEGAAARPALPLP